jgi:opine dehydrogenase
MTEATYCRGYVEAPGFKGIKAQPSLDHRYFNEDVGYGLVFMSDMGRQIGVPTPTMHAVLTLVSTMMGRDYVVEGKRTMKSLGLDGWPAAALIELDS